MAKNTCKLCFRRFASPRALAGHMRSHSMAAAKQQISSASSASTSLTAAADEDVGFKMPISIYALWENSKRADVTSSDGESEAESTAPRAKRAHAAAAAGGETEPVSSVSDATSLEEDVALSLLMLSHDSWPPVNHREGDDSDDGSDGDGDGDYTLPAPDPVPVEKQTWFQCSACKKVFPSYQALGGHRASHVRGGRGGCCAPPVTPRPPPRPQQQPPLLDRDGDEEDVDGKGQPRECPYCYRVFASGQALGGHTRSRVCSAAAATAATASADPIKGKSKCMIDLNIALPIEEMELSAVSDPQHHSSDQASTATIPANYN